MQDARFSQTSIHCFEPTPLSDWWLRIHEMDFDAFAVILGESYSGSEFAASFHYRHELPLARAMASARAVSHDVELAIAAGIL